MTRELTISTYLDRFEESISTLESNFDDIDGPLGQPTAGRPLELKLTLSGLRDESAREWTESETARFEALCSRLDTVVDHLGPAYDDQLLVELEYLVDTYPATINYFLGLDPIDIELWDDLNRRDSLEVLLRELRDRHDLREQTAAVEALDTVLKYQYREHLDTLQEYRDIIEKPYFPESFWWRHLDHFETDDENEY
ncbi:hypothetical protein ACFQH6_17555 [Halobacteriaceae archaeon GCM10025711]